MRALTGIAVGAVLVAIVIGAVANSTTADVAALMLGGLGCVLGVCLAFYAVGRSEDRERAQQPPDS